MVGNILFIFGLIVSLGLGFIYFRDLGDVSQMIMRVKRKNMIRFIRHEYRYGHGHRIHLGNRQAAQRGKAADEKHDPFRRSAAQQNLCVGN